MLYLLVALQAEARPLRGAFRLAARPAAGPFPHFAGDGVQLVVTGVGKVAMAAACGWLAGRASEPGLWLNVGIAGHRGLPLGSALLAHRVLDRATGASLYPPLAIAPPCPTGTVETVDRPEFDYPLDHAYDMEASAFVEVARHFAGAELVQVLKVVSDGKREDIAGLDRAAIGARVESLLPQIEELRQASLPLLEVLRRGEAEPKLFAELQAGRHFTFSDQVALRRLLRRLEALAPPGGPPAEVLDAHRGRELNKRLAAWMDGLPVIHAARAGA
jgi:adenosylhomocysteine nucleosidase